MAFWITVAGAHRYLAVVSNSGNYALVEDVRVVVRMREQTGVDVGGS